MTVSYPDLLNILKVLSLDELPKPLNPTIVKGLIQSRSSLLIEELVKQYKEGKQELIDKLSDLGYSGDSKKLHLNELWNLIGELCLVKPGTDSTSIKAPDDGITSPYPLWSLEKLEDHLAVYYGGKTLDSLTKSEAANLLKDLRVYRWRLPINQMNLLQAA